MPKAGFFLAAFFATFFLTTFLAATFFFATFFFGAAVAGRPASSWRPFSFHLRLAGCVQFAANVLQFIANDGPLDSMPCGATFFFAGFGQRHAACCAGGFEPACQLVFVTL